MHGRCHKPRRSRRARRRGAVRMFLQPCLLTLLRRGPAHGYSLLSGLTDFGFEVERMDPSVVYRMLREMESQGLVVSSWDADSLGPQRRVYRLTAAGEETLRDWIADLRRTRAEIDALLQAYEQTTTN